MGIHVIVEMEGYPPIIYVGSVTNGKDNVSAEGLEIRRTACQPRYFKKAMEKGFTFTF